MVGYSRKIIKLDMVFDYNQTCYEDCGLEEGRQAQADELACTS